MKWDEIIKKVNTKGRAVVEATEVTKATIAKVEDAGYVVTYTANRYIIEGPEGMEW